MRRAELIIRSARTICNDSVFSWLLAEMNETVQGRSTPNLPPQPGLPLEYWNGRCR